VVFISGNGNDHTVWADLEARVRELGYGTVVYDRAGLGQSPLFSLPYTIDAEADALAKTLAQRRVAEPVVLVAHSYGGLIAALFAEGNSTVAAIVLVDAVVPNELGAPVVDDILRTYRPQYEEVRRVAPRLAKAVIPVVEGFPATARRMERVEIDPEVPLIFVAAEKRDAKSDAANRYVEQRRREFIAASARREYVVAKGSGHNVMQDHPDEVMAAIRRALDAAEVGARRSR